MKKAFPVLLLFSACFLFEEEDENQNTNLTLSEGAIGVTTVRLHVEPEDSLAQFTFELTRDDSTVQTLSLQSDTLIKDTGLNPNTSYTYTGYWMDGTKRIGESNTLTLTTMDTTSHNFTWEMDTLGEGGSYLNDVWIVDENDIWVVGALSIDDSTLDYRGDINYNIAHWNGEEWIYQLVFHSGVTLSSIYYFNENDIWVSSGIPYHWNGEVWTMYHLWNMDVLGPDDGNVTQLWGTSSSNMYFAGGKGSIVHYDGNEFVKMESGTDAVLRDICGKNADNIWVSGFSLVTSSEPSIILSYSKNSWEILHQSFGYNPVLDDSLSSYMYSNWSYGDTLYISCAGGLWKEHIIDGGWCFVSLDSVGMETNISKVRGTGYNDVFWLSAWGELVHYNGKDWKMVLDLSKIYTEFPISSRGLSVKENMVVFVGNINLLEHALIVRGYR